MKKVILSVLLVAAIAIANAQQVQFGIKAGVNVASWTGSDADNSKSKIGFNAGALVNIPVSGGFSVQPELMYSGQGAKEEGTDSKANLDYLNIPVMAKYTFTGGFFAETGPQIGFLLSAKVDGVDLKDQFKSTDFAWGLGVGYQSSVGIGGGVRYNYGFSKLDKDGQLKAYNGVFQVGIHYMFGVNSSK
ncbi:MAG: porin family protein [Sphingobacteriales bacterium]